MENKFTTRKNILRCIWPYSVNIMLIYFVTLTIFPGIESEIHSCKYGDWFPIIIMATFNLTDFLGKLASIFFYRIHSIQLLFISVLRFVFIPLFTLSIVPIREPFFHSPFWPILFSMLLGKYH